MNATQYAGLNDSSHNTEVENRIQQILSEPHCSIENGVGPNIEIWYAKLPDFICHGIFVPFETHINVGLVTYRPNWKEEIFLAMQGENWSPNGEANELIEKLGLIHTSMSIGDVVVLFPPLSDDMRYCRSPKSQTWMLDEIGWKQID